MTRSTDKRLEAVAAAGGWATAAPGASPEDMPDWLVADLRSDHAGETGAVAIYRGILAVTGDENVRAFAEEHLRTEQRHLDLMHRLLPPRARSRLLFLWRIAGWLTGALPALAGRRAVFATIDAVESFVDRHYAEQIERLDNARLYPALRADLEQCRNDEIDHRDEARDALARPPGPIIEAWCWLVGTGSAIAVDIARRF